MQLNLINLSQGLIKHHGNWNTKDFVSVLFGFGTMVHSQGDVQTKRVFKGRCGELRGSASPLHMWYKVAPARGTKDQVTGTMGCRVTGRANNIIGGVKTEYPLITNHRDDFKHWGRIFQDTYQLWRYFCQLPECLSIKKSVVSCYWKSKTSLKLFFFSSYIKLFRLVLKDSWCPKIKMYHTRTARRFST